jgi:hypothetical protein
MDQTNLSELTCLITSSVSKCSFLQRDLRSAVVLTTLHQFCRFFRFATALAAGALTTIGEVSINLKNSSGPEPFEDFPSRKGALSSSCFSVAEAQALLLAPMFKLLHSVKQFMIVCVVDSMLRKRIKTDRSKWKQTNVDCWMFRGNDETWAFPLIEIRNDLNGRSKL